MSNDLEKKVWWYSNDREHKNGPVSWNDLKILYLNEKITATTKFWRDGQSDWELFSEIPELAKIIAEIPPPIHSIGETQKRFKPNENDPGHTDSESLREDIKSSLKEILPPRPWVRFWARLFDLTVFTVFFYFVIGLIEGYSNVLILPEFIINNNVAAGIISLPFALLLDAFCMAMFGNTPGKKILNIQVMNQNGSPIGLFQAIRRNMAIYIRGYGFGLPIINLFTLYNAYQTLTRRGSCTWDNNQNLTVIQRPVGIVKGMTFTVIFISFYVGLVTLELYYQELDRSEYEITTTKQKSSNSSQLEWKWSNPITKEIVYIDSSWVEQKKTDESPETLLALIHKTGNSIIYLIYENFEYDISLPAYVDALKEVKQEILGLVDFSLDSDNGYYSSFGKFDYEGDIMDSYVRAWSDNNKNFWHFVVITDADSKGSADDTAKILTSLIKSTKNKIEF